MLIKLKNEALVQDIVERTFESNFKYENGLSIKVQISEANGNLIPEVEDEHIQAVLEQYGTILKQALL
jgi:hypothetical protein